MSDAVLFHPCTAKAAVARTHTKDLTPPLLFCMYENNQHKLHSQLTCAALSRVSFLGFSTTLVTRSVCPVKYCRKVCDLPVVPICR